MGDKQPKDEKSERKQRRKEKREQQRREQQRRELESRERQSREQEKIQQTTAKSQNQHNEEQSRSSASTIFRSKKRKTKTAYYSAISPSEDEFADARSSSENFRDSISKTDIEHSDTPPKAKAKSAPSEPLPPILEEVNELDAQPGTSKTIPTKKKKKREEQDMAMEKEAERKEDEVPSEPLPPILEEVNELDAQPETSKTIPTKKKKKKEEQDMAMEKEAERKEDEAPEKKEEKPSEILKESPPQKLQEPINREKEAIEDLPKTQKIAEDTGQEPHESKESHKTQENNDENERDKKQTHTKDKANDKEPLPKVITADPTTPLAARSEQYPIIKNAPRTGGQTSDFKDLSDDFDDDDSEDYEVYIEKMKAKRKKMTKTMPNQNKNPEPWGVGETAYLGQGGAFVYMVIPPDGGYGWLVLLVSFLCQVIVDGIVLSLGIVLPFIAEDMDSSPSATALVASTQIGPITSAFINKYGFRPVALFGGTMAICTILISTLSTNLATLIIFYSIFGGMSLSMIWSSSQLIVGYYFEKYRPIASGISCSGAGAGVLIFSYMNSQLAPQVGWRNTSRIHVIFLLFVLIIVLVYIEVEPTRIGRMLDHNLPDTETESDETGVHTFFYSRITLHSTMHRHSKSLHGNLFVNYESTSRKESRLNKCFQSCCPPFRHFMQERRRISDQDPETKRVVIRQDPLDRQDIYYTGPADYEEYPRKNVAEILNENDKDIEIELLPSNNQKTQSIHYNLATRQESASRVRANQQSMYSMDDRTSRRSNAFLDFISPANWIHPKVKRAFNMLFDLRLLAVMEFQVLLASAFFFPMGFNIPFVYSKVRAELDPIYTNLISPAIGLSNFFFRVTSGFVAFKFRRHTTAICGYGIVFGGAVTLLSALYGQDIVWFQFLFAICFGVAPAFYSTLRAIIYVQMLGLDKLTNAFGLTAMAMGAGVFIGTFMGGLLIELTGGYVATFAFSGTCMILAGSLKLLLPKLVQWKNNRKTRKRTRFRPSTRH